MVPCCVKAQSPVWIIFGFLIVLECVVLSTLQEVLLVPEKSCRWSSLVLSLVHHVYILNQVLVLLSHDTYWSILMDHKCVLLIEF